MSDSFVQLLPDSTGKQVDMETVSTNVAALLYQQRAKLVGDSADVLFNILQTNQKVLACLRAILANLQDGSARATEDDFIQSSYD